MRASPSDGRNRPEPHEAAGARLRSTGRRAQERRPALITGGCILALGAMITVVVTASVTSSPSVITTPENVLRTARITTNSDSNGCWEKAFDNQTGRMLRSPKPCEAAAYDINGAPAPLGTIHRLDAISKSFSGR